jgi:DNA-binding IscR family transcriptional regulator
MLSQKAKYALRASLYMAERPGEQSSTSPKKLGGEGVIF